MTAYRIVGALLVLAAFGVNTVGAETISHSWYAGASYGASSLHHGLDEFSDGSVRSAEIDDSDSGWKLFGGRRLSEHLAIELSYVDLNNDVDGETTFSGVSDGSGSELSPGPVGIDIDEPRAAAVALVDTLPLSNRATALLRIGAAAWRADRTTFHGAGSSTESESGVGLMFGIGLQYRVSDRVDVRIDAERYFDIVGDDIDLGSIGVVVHLGKRGR